MKTKFFLYARKSTEDEERQVMSIEAQLAELAEFAKRENIEIAETFIESKSAKKRSCQCLCCKLFVLRQRNFLPSDQGATQ